MPTVSVIMSAFNAEAFLREAMDSILAQTFCDFELIVVDDASTDRTAEVLAEYSDSRIRVIRNPSNVGVGVARNRGLRLARGKYIAVHDADDASVPDRLAQQVAYFEAHPEVGLIGSTAFYVQTPRTLAETFPQIKDFNYPNAVAHADRKGRVEFDTSWLALPACEPPMALCISPLSDLAIAWTLLLHCAFCTATVMFRSALYERLGGFSEDAEHRYVEDYPMYSLFARHARVANIESPLVTWHAYSTSTSAQNDSEQRKQQEAVQQNNFCWIMDREALSPVAWSAWRKFVAPNSKTSPFTRAEVDELRSILPFITSNFYAAYGFGEGEEVARHRRRTLYAWARHAIGLSYKPGKTVDISSRLLMAVLGLRLTGNIFFSAKATRNCERRSFVSWVQGDSVSY